MKIPKLSTVAKKARKQAFRGGDPVFRHVVTVYVDTFERSAEKVLNTVQSNLDEHTFTIQPDGITAFEGATVVSATRTEKA